MANLGFIQQQDEDDESFNLRIISATLSESARELLEKKCSECTYLDKLECLINPKCTIHSRAKRISEDGVRFHWQIESWLEREDKHSASQIFFQGS